MKKIVFLALLVISVIACKESTGSQKIVTESNGNINYVSVIIENSLWKGKVGDSIRKMLATPFLALPQDEAQFTLKQIPPQAYNGFARNNRTFIHISSGKSNNFGFVTDKYAAPQLGVVVTGTSHDEIIRIVDENKAKIISAFRSMEITESQKRHRKALLSQKPIQDQLGVTIEIPATYRYTKTLSDDFFWIRKSIKSGGNMNILMYELPYNTFHQDSTMNNQIVKVRDSIGKIYVQGEDEGSYVKTEDKFTPYLLDASINDKRTFETRGTWDIEGQFMGGPYLSYLVDDKENNRYVVLEGFVYAPRLEKRDYIFELEAILRTAKLK